MGVHEGGWCLPSISPPVAKTGGAFASTCSPFAFGDFLLMAVNLLLPAKPPSSRRYVTQLCPGGMARLCCIKVLFSEEYMKYSERHTVLASSLFTIFIEKNLPNRRILFNFKF